MKEGHVQLPEALGAAIVKGIRLCCALMHCCHPVCLSSVQTINLILTVTEDASHATGCDDGPLSTHRPC